MKVTLKVLENVASKHPDTKNWSEGEDFTVEEVTYFFCCVLVFEFFERIEGLRFHASAMFLESRQMIWLDSIIKCKSLVFTYKANQALPF